MTYAARRKILIAGPWLNELGWEIMVWQAAVRYRRLRGGYDDTYVITFRNREFLYEDCRVFPHQMTLAGAGFGIEKPPRRLSAELISGCIRHFGITGKYDVFSPAEYLSLTSKVMRRFRKDLIFRKFYRRPAQGDRFDLAFHFRGFERAGDTEKKSFSTEKADALVASCIRDGFRVCCIGAPGYSYVAKGAENRQSSDLGDTVAVMCASKLVVGGSSAPIHLASHCGIPIVVWISTPPGSDRFFGIGNPFNAKAFIVSDSTFDPEIADIRRTILDAWTQI